MANIDIANPGADAAALSAALYSAMTARRQKAVRNIAVLHEAATSAPAINPWNAPADAVTTVTQAGSSDTTTYGRSISLNGIDVFTGVGGDPYIPFGSTVRLRVPNGGAAANRFEFVMSGSGCEVQLENVASSKQFLVSVDGRYVGSGGAGAVVPTEYDTDNGLYVRITTSTAGPHLVVIERARAAGIAGVRTPVYDNIGKAGRYYPPVLFVTDSYGLTSSPAPIFQGYSFPMTASHDLGWSPYADTAGGTGYSGGTNDFDDASRLAIVSGRTYRAIVVCGGINDIGNAVGNPTFFQGRCVSTWTAQRTRNPDALIIVCGPWAGNRNPVDGGSDIVKTERAIKTAFDTWADPNSIFVPISDTVPGPPIMQGDGRVIVFTGALAGATSGTLASVWAGATGSGYSIRFSDGTIKTGVTLTNGSTSVSWTGAVTASAVAAAYSSADGTASWLVGPDGTHPYDRKANLYLGKALARRIREALGNFV